MKQRSCTSLGGSSATVSQLLLERNRKTQEAYYEQLLKDHPPGVDMETKVGSLDGLAQRYDTTSQLDNERTDNLFSKDNQKGCWIVRKLT